MIISLFNKALNSFGLEIKKREEILPVDISSDPLFMKLYGQCRPYTMTSIERMFSLYQCLEYVIKNNLEGEFVECGVWKGGSSMMMALYLKEKGITNRKLYLYDTFEGMSEPTDADKTFSGEKAKKLLNVQKKENEDSIWCYSSIDEVRDNIAITGYPVDNIVLVKGKVEDTLQLTLPGPVALLRLDTDWYESTKIELEKLFPLLVSRGILIIDDFGHWEGAKKAVVEYFSNMHKYPLLHRIDYTGRIMIKD